MKEISLNFGAIKDTVFSFASKELVKEGVEKSTVMSKFLTEIKNNHILKLQYLIFKNLENGHFSKDSLAERYIAQNLQLLENVNWQDVLNINKRIRMEILNEHHVEGDSGKGNLYENIHILIESKTRPGYTNIAKSQNAYEYILQHVTRELPKKEDSPNEENDMPNFFSWRYINEMAVNNFNQRYAHLNEDEQKLLIILLSPYQIKETYLGDLKKTNFEIIDFLAENEDSENKNILEQFKNKMNKLPEVNENSIDEIIINCAELNGALKEF